jgi:hypothetical protein
VLPHFITEQLAEKIAYGILGGLFLIALIAGLIANSAKTGFVADSPWNWRTFSKDRSLHNDYTKLHLYIKLLVVTAVISAILVILLVGFYWQVIGIFVLMMVVPSAFTYWYLVIVKVDEKKTSD